MVVLIFNQFKKVFEHVVVRATDDSFAHVIFRLVLFFDLAHEELNFLFEKLMTLSFIFLVSWIKFNLDQVSMIFQQVDECLFVSVVPSVLEHIVGIL